MLRFSSRRLLLAIFSVLILMAMTAGFPARAGGQLSEDAVQKLVDPDRILQVLQDDAAGNVPVIVEFGMPELPDASAFEDAEARDAAHISAVHQAQDAILGRAFVEEGGASAALSEELNFKRMNYSPMFAITVNGEMLARLAEDPAVLRIHQDGADEPMLNQGSPTSLARIGMPAAYTAGATGNGWRVAILDSGGRRTHKFLSSRIVSAACYNTNSANSSSLCPGGVTSSTNIDSANDCDNTTIAGCGHGTHVAGTAGGFNSSLLSGEPANGVARDGRLISINVFSRFNSGSCTNPLSNGCVLAVVSDQILGLERVFALRNSMNIAAVNMSLGGSTIFSSACDSDSRKSIIDQLRAAGIATVIAAGNGSSNAGISAPACISSAISVANSTKADVRWGSSNWHSLVDLVAPGTSIYASDVSGATGNTWSFKTGTSMAAPHVAGAFAALRTTSPDASVQQILNALKATGTNITSAGVTKPRINVNTARNHLGTPATITSPAQGTGIATASQTFTWSGGVGATQYWLYVGTTGVGSANILNANNGTSTSRTVSGLPASGTIFVRLWTLTASGWFTRDTTYTMGRRAVMSSPANGTGLSGSSATFNWTSGTNVSEYWLFVGTTGVGSANVLNTTTGSNTSRTVSGLPLTGTIYVRLWSRIGSTWHSLDYSYTGGLRAVVTSPSPGSGLSGSTATFSWSSGSNVNQYYLYVGNTGTGSSNILIENMGTTRSKLVTGLPLSGTINVRLWSRIGSTWHSIDHTYTGGLRAVMTSPTQGTPIVGSSVTLNWSTGVNVSEYWVFVGSTGVGSSNILSASTGTTRTRTVTGLPASGTVFRSVVVAHCQYLAQHRLQLSDCQCRSDDDAHARFHPFGHGGDVLMVRRFGRGAILALCRHDGCRFAESRQCRHGDHTLPQCVQPAQRWHGLCATMVAHRLGLADQGLHLHGWRSRTGPHDIACTRGHAQWFGRDIRMVGGNGGLPVLALCRDHRCRLVEHPFGQHGERALPQRSQYAHERDHLCPAMVAAGRKLAVQRLCVHRKRSRSGNHDVPDARVRPAEHERHLLVVGRHQCLPVLARRGDDGGRCRQCSQYRHRHQHDTHGHRVAEQWTCLCQIVVAAGWHMAIQRLCLCGRRVIHRGSVDS